MMATIVPAAFMPAFPEIILAILSCVTLLTSLFVKKESPVVYMMSQFSLIVVGACLFAIAGHFPHTVIFHNQFVFDSLAVVLKAAVLLTVFVVFVYSRQYNLDRNIPHEFYILALLSTLGMMVLISGHDLLPIYLGVELFSLPIYAMVALERRQGRCIEAAMKYFIIGAFASGMLLYGLSLIFGLTHSLSIATIAQSIQHMSASSMMVAVVALVFVMAGVAFKLGAAPFHMWVPDVYEGASSSVTLFIATAPKLAAFALVVRLILEISPALHVASQDMFIVLSVASIAIGNIVALVQTNLKRLLAYSSIAHIGYVLLGFAAMSKSGEAAALFYAITYAISTCVAFGLLVLLSRAGAEADKIDDLSGLSSRNPWLAFVMLMAMFSMAGIPPFVGFIAKLGLLEALINAHLTWLAVVALLFAIVGSFYYLRVVKAMYFESPQSRIAYPCKWDTRLVMTLNGLAVLVLGILPGGLFALCHLVFKTIT